MALELLVRVIPDAVRADPLTGTGLTPEPSEPLAFHRTLPGFAPTALRELPGLAATLGVGRVLAKDETARAGLPAFKILGASWAAARAVRRGWLDDAVPLRLPELRAAIEGLRANAPGRDLRLVTATDGNHGRGVARIARLLGLGATILVPAGTVRARIAAIASEGADVIVVDGGYDAAVERAAALADADRLVVSDTAWEGYREVPGDVIDGYSTMFLEVEEELAAAGLPAPTHVVLQCGVGAFPAAAVRHFAPRGARFLVVEPTNAACVLASTRAGRITAAPGPHDSAMAGLNCGLPSPLAWPILDRLVDAFVAIDDGPLPAAARALAAEGIDAGESGMAGVAGLLAIAAAGRLAELGIGPASTVLVVITEGVTDPDARAALLAG